MNPTSPTPQQRIQARLRRSAVIRRRVTAAALTTFALAFATISATGSVGSAATATAVSAPAVATSSTESTAPAARHHAAVLTPGAPGLGRAARASPGRPSGRGRG